MQAIKTKNNYFIIALSLFFISCQQQQYNNAQEQEVRIVIQEVDTTAPILERIEPEDGTVVNNISDINVSGIFSDASDIVEVTINGQNVRFSLITEENSLKIYGFSVNVDLKIGVNNFTLVAKDQDGNFVEKKFSYTREDSVFDGDLVVRVEKDELPLAGATFVEVLHQKDGKEIPIPADKVILKAQQGYFSGFEYHAPPYGGVDIITAFSNEKQAKGKTYIKIISPKLKHDLKGPENIQIGKVGEYNIKAENYGEIDAVDTRVVVKLPDFLKVKNISNQGKFIPVANEIHWSLGSLTSGISKNISFSVDGTASNKDRIITSILSSKEEIQREVYPVQVTGEAAVEHFCRPSIAEIEKTISTRVKLVANEDIQNLKLEYDFPDECVFIDAQVESPSETKVGFANTGKTVQFSTISELKKDQSITYIVNFVVKRYGQINNNARISLISERGSMVKSEYPLTIPTLD